MSKNIKQVYDANPITSNANTDLMYFGQSPYTAGDDAAMTFANFSAQFNTPNGAVLLHPAAKQTISTYNLEIPSLQLSTTTALIDSNGNTSLGINANAGAVNYVNVFNNSTGQPVGLNSLGSDSNIGITLVTKGTGVFGFNTTATSNQVLFNVGAGMAFNNIFNFPSATNTYTWPNATGTVALTSNIPSLPLSLANGGTAASLIASNGGIFYSNASTGAILSGTATAGQHLQSGSNAAPSWTTATFPSTATSTGTVLRANGTNWIASTATFADTYTASNLLYSNGSNTVTGLATANNGTLVTSSSGVPSILAGPGTTGQILQSNAAAAPSFSTASYPSTTTVNQILYSSSTNTVAGLATANSSVLVTSSGGAPSLSTTLPTNLAMGTPASITLTNGTGLPIGGITGLGTGVGTALAANVNGSGAISLTTSPTFVTPVLGAATATSINFGGSTLSNYVANTSWTPTFSFATVGDLSVAYTTQAGTYTRIGNVVYYTFNLVFSPTFTTSSGSGLVASLPINAATGSMLGNVAFSGGVVFSGNYVNLSSAGGQTTLTMVRTITTSNFGNLTTAAFPTGGTYTIVGSGFYFV